MKNEIRVLKHAVFGISATFWTVLDHCPFARRGRVAGRSVFTAEGLHVIADPTHILRRNCARNVDALDTSLMCNGACLPDGELS